jgi:hypothetical protein
MTADVLWAATAGSAAAKILPDPVFPIQKEVARK